MAIDDVPSCYRQAMLPDAPAEHAWTDGDLCRFCVHCGLIDQPKPSAKRYPLWQPMSEGARDRRHAKIHKVWDRDGPGCFYCGHIVPIDEVVLDHFVPRNAGGSDNLVNRRAACKRCDQRKGGRMPEGLAL